MLALYATLGIDPEILTHREREFLELVLLGNNIKELSKKLGCTPRTAQFHVSNLLRKLGVENRLKLLARALALRSSPSA